jgi:hypothetical protein
VKRRCAICRVAVSDGIVCESCLERSAHWNGEPQARRTMEELPLDSLAVPKAYQREERPYLVRRIVREFNPDLVGLLTVVRDGDGAQWILDGQHRWLALVGLGYESALCEVLHDVPLERQAEIFSGRHAGASRLTRVTPSGPTTPPATRTCWPSWPCCGATATGSPS